MDKHWARYMETLKRTSTPGTLVDFWLLGWDAMSLSSWFENDQRTWAGLEEYLREGGSLEGQGVATADLGQVDDQGDVVPDAVDYNPVVRPSLYFKLRAYI
eukprot:2087960-Amphidinium_carterae.1